MSPTEKILLYRALRRHDGHSLCPEFPLQEREALTAILDGLRFQLFCDPAVELLLRGRVEMEALP